MTGTPGITTCTNAALTTPLLFDPGDRWEYGISIDWIGKMVETVSGQKLDRYFQDNIFGPLGMKDTSFTLSASQRARLASVHQRDEKGALAPIEFGQPELSRVRADDPARRPLQRRPGAPRRDRGSHG